MVQPDTHHPGQDVHAVYSTLRHPAVSGFDDVRIGLSVCRAAYPEGRGSGRTDGGGTEQFGTFACLLGVEEIIM